MKSFIYLDTDFTDYTDFKIDMKENLCNLLLYSSFTVTSFLSFIIRILIS